MRNNLKLQRNLSFFLILILASGYILFVISTFSKVSSGFIMQLIFLIEYLKNPVGSIVDLIFSRDFLITVPIGIVTLLLLLKIIRGVIRSINNFKRTREFVSSINAVKNERGLRIFNSKEALVFTAGFITPQIYISKKLLKGLSEAKLDAIINHEIAHKKNFDPLRNFIINFVRYILPNLPGKNKVFEEYEVLVELSCDQFAEKILQNRKPIIEALNDVLALNISTNLVNPGSGYSTGSSRIAVLVGRMNFSTKRIFFTLLFLISFFLLGSIYARRTEAFFECKHLVTCIEVLFSGEAHFDSRGRQVCVSHRKEEVLHCVDYDDYHLDFQTSLNRFGKSSL